MQQRDGVFIVIEGTDGSGKGTQSDLLVKHLRRAGHDVALFDFPRYDEPSSYFVKQYLNGAYGDTADAVNPYTASLFFALDRFEAAPHIKRALDAGKVVVANRFTGSNMAAQGTKFANAHERRGYFIWLDNLEFEMLQIPRPNLNLVLRVPAEIARTLIDKKDKRAYTDKKRDLHEADLDLMRRSVEVYDDLCQLFPRDFVRIDCTRSEEILPITTIESLIWEKVSPHLPKPSRPRKSAKAAVARDANVSSDGADIEAANPTTSETGDDFLARAVTNLRGNIYSFTDAASPYLAVAAIARLGQTGEDVRAALAGKQGRQSKLEFPPRLAGAHVVVENASGVLAQKLAASAEIAFCEQPDYTARFDKKATDGSYTYFVPESLDSTTAERYRAAMDTIFDHYAELVRELTEYLRKESRTPKAEQTDAWEAAIRRRAYVAARPVLPLAARTNMGMHASMQAFEDLAYRLQADDVPEVRQAAEAIAIELRKINPQFRAAKPTEPNSPRPDGPPSLKKLAAQYLPTKHTDTHDSALQLAEVWPRNELDLVPDMLYGQTDVPLAALQHIVAAWPYDKKVNALRAYVNECAGGPHTAAAALDKAHYTWDVLGSYQTFRSLQRSQIVRNCTRQPFTPRHGFAMPELIEAAGLGDTFETCFDTSLELHSLLQSAGHATEAEYAGLLGHKLRWTMTCSANDMARLSEYHDVADADTRQFLEQLFGQLAETHPLLAETLRPNGAALDESAEL